MPITTIDKFKQPNGQTFYILESQDVEHIYKNDNNEDVVTSVRERLEFLSEKVKDGVDITSLDERYYTEDEIDVLLSNKSDADHTHAGYADAEHNHNEVYYTKDEIDAMELITVDDIYTICGSTIEDVGLLTLAEGVSF